MRESEIMRRDDPRWTERSPPGPGTPLSEVAATGHRRIETICLVAVTLLGGFVMFAQLGHPSIWIDEAHVYRYCRGDLHDIVAKSTSGLVNTSPVPLLLARLI